MTKRFQVVWRTGEATGRTTGAYWVLDIVAPKGNNWRGPYDYHFAVNMADRLNAVQGEANQANGLIAGIN